MAKRAKHILVAGSSGGGKTTKLRQYHAEFKGYSAFLTTKPNERKAEKSPPRRIRKSSCSYPADIQKVRAWAFKRDGPVQIIVDEVQNAPSFRDSEGADGPVRRGLHEDRDRGIKWVIATQNPQDLRTNANNYGPLQQCEYFVWCGPVKEWHSGFTSWLSLDELDMPTEPFQCVTIEPTRPPRIVGRHMTNPAYA